MCKNSDGFMIFFENILNNKQIADLIIIILNIKPQIIYFNV